MRFVPVKSDDQLDLQSLHRVRERWVIAVAVTGPTPGIATSLRQASFSRAIFSTDLSARSIFSASCSSSCFSSASNTSTAPDSLDESPASMLGNALST
jgi:hypothetical protein